MSSVFLLLATLFLLKNDQNVSALVSSKTNTHNSNLWSSTMQLTTRTLLQTRPSTANQNLFSDYYKFSSTTFIRDPKSCSKSLRLVGPKTWLPMTATDISESSSSSSSSSSGTVGSNNNNNALLGQPYKFDFDLLHDSTITSTTTTTTTTNQNNHRLEGEENVEKEEDDDVNDESAATMLVINNEEAVETKKIDIGEVNSDLAFSMLSNRFFILGASTDLISCLWDILFGAPSTTTTLITATSTSSSIFWHTLYIIVGSIAPFVYLLNSFVDVQWAEHRNLLEPNNNNNKNVEDHSQHYFNRRETTPYMSTSGVLVQQQKEVEEGQQQTIHEKVLSSSSSIPSMMQEGMTSKTLLTERQVLRIRRRIKTFSPKRQLIKVVKRSAHRHEYYAAFSFGVAAFFSVVNLVLVSSPLQSSSSSSSSAIFLPGSDQSIFDSLSVHTYLLSAIFAVTRSRHRPWSFSWSETPDILEDIGDALFLVGSSMDVILCDSHFDDNLPLWPLLSAFLWFLDACFYLRSDVITTSAYNTVSLSDQWVLPSSTTKLVESTVPNEIRLHHDNEHHVPAHRSYL